MRFPTLTDAIAVVFAAIAAEPRRLWRGLQAMADVFGKGFTAAILAVMLLLLLAIGTVKDAGTLMVLFGGLCCLLAIRAHDMGEEQDEYRSEYDEYWRGSMWSPEQIAELQAQGRAPEPINRQDDHGHTRTPRAVPMWSAHPPAEL